jgi:hypothetical protein
MPQLLRLASKDLKAGSEPLGRGVVGPGPKHEPPRPRPAAEAGIPGEGVRAEGQLPPGAPVEEGAMGPRRRAAEDAPGGRRHQLPVRGPAQPDTPHRSREVGWQAYNRRIRRG